MSEDNNPVSSQIENLNEKDDRSWSAQVSGVLKEFLTPNHNSAVPSPLVPDYRVDARSRSM
jgi:hypothetical protein